MENIAIFLAVFVISFFTIASVGSDRAIQTYSKLSSFGSINRLINDSGEPKAAVLSSLYKTASTTVDARIVGDIKIQSIDQMKSDDVSTDGVKIKKLSVYVIFANPRLKKDGSDWRIHAKMDVMTVDRDGKKTNFLNGLSLQEINNKYSYKLDSGAFVFNVDIKADTPGEYTSIFTVHDIFSDKKDAKTVTIKI